MAHTPSTHPSSARGATYRFRRVAAVLGAAAVGVGVSVLAAPASQAASCEATASVDGPGPYDVPGPLGTTVTIAISDVVICGLGLAVD